MIFFSYLLISFNIFRYEVSLALVMVVAIVTGQEGNEVRLPCMEDYDYSYDVCAIVEHVNVTAGDTVVISNSDRYGDATDFIVKESNWEVIPSSVFSTFSNLHRIEMSANIKRLTAGTFANADNLNTIQLNDNQIVEIPQNAFIGAAKLRIIALPANKIENIEDGAFNGLTNLTHLYLTRNKLRIIRNGTFAGTLKLKRIELDRNQIDTIESNAFHLSSLEYIDLGHNRLKTLAADIFNAAPILKTLILNDNEFWQVSDLMAKLNLRKLCTLVFANNPADVINLAHALNLPKLENLNVRNTSSFLHVEMLNATKTANAALEAIDLSSNNLTCSNILSTLEIFPKLVDLNLEENWFEKIDGLNRIEGTFKELRTLNIGCNRFECQWLANEVQTLNVTLDVLHCPEPMIVGAKNVRNVNCV